MNNVRDLNTSFKTMRTIALACIIGFVVLAVSAGYGFYKVTQDAGRRVYVVTNSGSAAALAVQENTHTPFEARNMIKGFMRTMFGHDQYTFKQNLDAALPLIEGAGGRRIFENFNRGQVLQNYQRYSARSVLDVDSIYLDMSARPYSGRVYTKQRIFIGDQQRQSLPMAARFNLIETDRSDENPYGLLITNFDYIAYNPPVSREEKEFLKQQEADRQRRLRDAAAGAGVAPSQGYSNEALPDEAVQPGR
ncbi:conjugal transfer protein TraK [Adhaeribacter rhizoryzae]|uniref:Conjugal transfer protein TraK n=1 Tax=Adhaeribacter rhizoryzae TaxID=2607907 RepID=A0A5M6CWQ2_9BACT|nr:conjugal transfer protein TraK [Adhaeribacter rhizoryzae]KAA5539648.1 conjugal transfer protein TraK [Adhaeribacter rhizoryzae]